MLSPSYLRASRFGFSFLSSLYLLAIASAATLVSGCAGGTGSGAIAEPSGSTTVVLFASSSANDQAAAFTATLDSLTLTSKSGKTVSVLASPVGDEFIHLNGHVEPLATVSVPQDTYVSASATFGGVFSICAGQVPGNNFRDEFPGQPNSTITLPSPISVSGAAMGLVLNLQVAPLQGGCPSTVQFSSGFLSAFNLTSVSLATQTVSSANVTTPGLQGIISSVDAGGTGFTVSALVNSSEVPNAPSWHALVNGNTVFQTIGGASQLAMGQPVTMDLSIQSDGSLLATRVGVISTDTTTLTTIAGPSLEVSSGSFAFILDAAQKGYLPVGEGGFGYVNLGGATFQISGQLANLGMLPFTPSFNAANMVDGQYLTLTTQATSNNGGPSYVPITTLTLMPQTINGTVSAISKSGNFTTYTVTLAPYDLFPQFATQPGQTTVLTSPSTVTVYADSNTQMLNSNGVGVGGVLRFYGLVFNDNGALRMDCAQISNGVAE